jgi:hypothetical protein
MAGSKERRWKTIKEALEYIPKHPDWSGGTRVDSPVWESVARELFQHANNPDRRVVGSVNRAIRAQKLILNRTTGLRRAGTHPAQRAAVQLNMVDLTGGATMEEES